MNGDKVMFSESILCFTFTQIISALPQLYGREAEVIVRCTKMLHNRRDYLRRRAKVRVHRLKDLNLLIACIMMNQT